MRGPRAAPSRRPAAARVSLGLEQRAPLRVLFPRAPADELIEAVLINTGGGVVGGDRLRVEVEAGAAAQARVGTQAAEKVYRSAGPSGALEVRLVAGPEAWLESLPQETILWPEVRSGASCIGPVLVARWLAREPAALRAAVRRFCAGFRHAVAGLPEGNPAIWRA